MLRGGSYDRDEQRRVMSEVEARPATGGMTTILVPLDSSAEARTALPYVTALATPGIEILLLTVVANQDVVEAAEAALEHVAQRLHAAGQTVRTEVAVGEPAERILETATSQGAGMIVMASH